MRLALRFNWSPGSWDNLTLERAVRLMNVAQDYLKEAAPPLR